MEITREELSILKLPANYVLLKSLQDNNYIKIKSEDGEKKLYIDRSFSEAEHADVYCEVVKVPEKLTYQKPGDPKGLKWIPDGGMRLLPGDETLMTWRGYTDAMDLAAKLMYESEIQDGKYNRFKSAKKAYEPKVFIVEDELYMLVPYDEIIAYRRNGEVHPVNGFVILKPLEKKVNTALEVIEKKSQLQAEIYMSDKPVVKYCDYPDTTDGVDNLPPGSIAIMERSSDIKGEEHLHRTFFPFVCFRAQRRDILALADKQLSEI